MPRLLTTSASAVRRLGHKASLMGVDVEAEEVRESQVTALADVSRKWHLPPAFSVEFIAYVVDRERRISQFREQVRTYRLQSNSRYIHQITHNFIAVYFHRWLPWKKNRES